MDIGDKAILDYGFCISSNANPSISDSIVSQGQQADKGIYSKTVTSVSINHKYYVRAFIKDDSEIKYGKELNFLIPTVLTINDTSKTVEFSSGSFTVNVISNTSWAAQSNQSWLTCTANGTGNGTITINYSDNISSTIRNASIIVTTYGNHP